MNFPFGSKAFNWLRSYPKVKVFAARSFMSAPPFDQYTDLASRGMTVLMIPLPSPYSMNR